MTSPRTLDTRGAEDQQTPPATQGDDAQQHQQQQQQLKATPSLSPSPPPRRAAPAALSAAAGDGRRRTATAPPAAAPAPPADRPLLERLAAAVALSSFVGALNVATSTLCLSLFLLLSSSLCSPVGWLLLSLLLLLAYCPLGAGAAGAWRWGASESHAALTAPAPEFARRFVRYVTAAAGWYFPVRVVVEGEEVAEEEEEDEAGQVESGGGGGGDNRHDKNAAAAERRPKQARDRNSTIQADGAYVIALEPHSVLPLAISAVFSTDSALLPRALRGQRVHGLASSVCFGAPLIRHLWWFLGIRPVTRRSIGRLITGREDGKAVEEEEEEGEEQGGDVAAEEEDEGAADGGLRRRRPTAAGGQDAAAAAAAAPPSSAAPLPPLSPSLLRPPRDRRSVVIVPGGVQECLYMRPPHTGVETAYLTRRKGFVRLAMRCGADAVVPAFAFGQSHGYSWLRPGPPLFSEAFVARVARSMGAVPLAIWGRWGTPAPQRRPMVVVVGRPLPLPRPGEWAARATPGGDPPADLVQAHLDGYIAALKQLVETHKAAVGFPETTLVVM